MTKDKQISAYNRLQGTMVVVDEMIRLYDTPADVLGELLVAYQALKMAQNNLGWDPGRKIVEGGAK